MTLQLQFEVRNGYETFTKPETMESPACHDPDDPLFDRLKKSEFTLRKIYLNTYEKERFGAIDHSSCWFNHTEKTKTWSNHKENVTEH